MNNIFYPKGWIEAVRPYAINNQFEYCKLPNELRDYSLMRRAATNGLIRKVRVKRSAKTAIWRIVK